MKIEFEPNRVSFENLFKFLLAGYAVGTAVLVLPLLLLSVLIAPEVNGLSGNRLIDGLVVLMLLPVMLIGHTVVLAMLFKLGFFVYRKFGRLEFVTGSR